MPLDDKSLTSIDQAKEAALGVLLHNARGPFQGLPRTAGWGYPEPYTRDLMISALGFLATGNEELADALRRTLVALAANQTPLGHIPSLAHDPGDRGAVAYLQGKLPRALRSAGQYLLDFSFHFVAAGSGQEAPDLPAGGGHDQHFAIRASSETAQ